jgi:hypothetical protein
MESLELDQNQDRSTKNFWAIMEMLTSSHTTEGDRQMQISLFPWHQAPEATTKTNEIGLLLQLLRTAQANSIVDLRSVIDIANIQHSNHGVVVESTMLGRTIMLTVPFEIPRLLVYLELGTACRVGCELICP